MNRFDGGCSHPQGKNAGRGDSKDWLQNERQMGYNKEHSIRRILLVALQIIPSSGTPNNRKIDTVKCLAIIQLSMLSVIVPSSQAWSLNLAVRAYMMCQTV